MIYRTTAKPLQDIIISSDIYSSSIVLWIFSLININLLKGLRARIIFLVIDFCASYLLDQLSLILKLVLRCVRKLSIGRIQTGYKYLLPPQVCVRWWQGCPFLLLHLSILIHSLDSRKLLKLFKSKVL